MAEQIILSNDIIRAEFSTKGAELISVKKDGKEKIWIGDPAVWGFHTPFLFPICGALKDDKYIYEGAEYTMQKHGYIRFMEFDVERHNDNEVVFLHRSSDETIKQYPFHYELRVIYTLKETALKVSYCVKNLDDKCMYYSIGSHEGYYCPEGIEEYSILFEQNENFDSNVLNGRLLDYKTINFGENTCELPLKYEYFELDTLVFLQLKSRKLSLKNRRTNDEVKIEFDGHDVLLLWTKPDAKYICIEPWCGCLDFVDSDYDFINKKGIIQLSGKEEKTTTHTIIF